MDARNKSNITEALDSGDWLGTVRAINVVIFTLLALTFWLLICFMIYGTKANRWRSRPGNSSLSSGRSYILCAVFSTIPFLAIVAAINQHPRFPKGTDICGGLVDGAITAYFLSLYTAYLFLWLMQRRCYQHPCVIERVNKRTGELSVAYAVVLTTSFVVIVVLYNIFVRAISDRGVCMYDPLQAKKIMVNVIVCAILVMSKIAIIMLSIYTAVRARFPSTDTPRDGTPDSGSNNWKIFYRWFFPKNSKVYFGPVEKSVRRTVIASLIIVFSDVIFVVLDVIILPVQFPLTLHVLGYAISNMVNVICMVSVFGFFQKLLNPCCPQKLKYRPTNIVHISHLPSHSSNQVEPEVGDPDIAKTGD